MKKFLALLLAAIMVLSMGITAAAEGEGYRKADLTGHTYKAYQIFSGTQADGDATLGAIEWGSGIDSAAFLTALIADTTIGSNFNENMTAKDVAEAIADWDDDSAEAKAFARAAENNKKGDGAVPGDTLDAGYYLVVDESASVPVGEGDDPVWNLALLQLTKKGTFDIATKVEVPEVIKKVSDDGALICTSTEEGHVHGKECYNWSESNNVAIGDTVHFKVESAVPATAKDYDYYFFIVNDTLSAGLDYTADSIKVFIDGEEAKTTDYSVKVNGQNIQVALADAKDNAGKAVVVTYDAVLNEKAVIGVKGNPNEVTVDFSNNPNEDYDGEPDDDDNPGFPADEKDYPKGQTPKDYTITFTSQINIYKVDENTDPLSGAEFTLTGEGLNLVLVWQEVYVKDEEGEYWLLNDGTYTKDTPVTEAYMKDAADGATAGYVVAETDFDGDTIEVGGKKYREFVPAEDKELKVYILVNVNTDQYYNTSEKYKSEWKAEAETAAESGETMKIVGVVDENGLVNFAGLPAGTYTISETVVPAGYNPIADITFKTTWTAPEKVTEGNEDCTWSVATDDKSGVKYNADEDAFEITIVNQKGSTLPETGGIGTRIFYIGGAILLIGAAVLLITKKRMA